MAKRKPLTKERKEKLEKARVHSKRPSDAEINKRILTIYKLMVNGASHTDIKQFCRESLGLTSNGTADRYMKLARDKIFKENSEEIEELRKESNAKFKNIFYQLMKEKKYRDAAYALSQQCKINGLPDQTTKNTFNFNITPESKEKLSLIFGDGEQE